MNPPTAADRAHGSHNSAAEYPPSKRFCFAMQPLVCEIKIPREAEVPLPVMLHFDTGNTYTVVTKAFLEMTSTRVQFFDLKEAIDWGRHTYRRIAQFCILLDFEEVHVSAVILEEDPGSWLCMGTEDMISKKIDFLFSSRQISFANGGRTPMKIQGDAEFYDTYSYGPSRRNAREAYEERPVSAGDCDSDTTLLNEEGEEITVRFDEADGPE